MHDAPLSPTTAEYDTVARMFWHGVRMRGDAILMRQKELGIWRAYSWQQVAQIVADTAAGLAKLGLLPGEVVSVLSNTKREWVWADLGVQTAGGVVNGIYPTDAASQVEFQCTDSSTRFLFVENEEQLDKFLEVRERLPLVEKVIVFDMEGLTALAEEQVISFEELARLGQQERVRDPQLVERRLASRTGGDLAVLVYTSGTTGRPKGAMLSNANIIAACLATREALYRDLPAGSERVSFLPLCHVAERIGGEYVNLLLGAVMNFVENPDTVFENVREVQPDVFIAVPRVWEKLYSSLAIALKEATRFEQWAYARAIAVGRQVAQREEQWQAIGFGLRWRYWLARKLVLNSLRRAMGLDRLRFGLTGAAPISPELIRWYRAMGIDLRELWGMTELTGGATVTPDRPRPGSIGLPYPLMELRLSPEGEILVRGPTVFMGYLNQPEKTLDAFVDGWLRTGDAGRVDEQGYYFITDRIKDIIITAGGKNITPSEWENQLKFSPYVTDAVVIGDKRAFLSCLVMLDHENVEQWGQDQRVAFSDFRSLCRSREVIALIGAEIERVNREFARVEQIKDFRLIDSKLTPEDEELTPTMKLKRRLVNQKYHELIESMYSAKAA